MKKKYPFKINVQKFACNQIIAFHLDEPIDQVQTEVIATQAIKIRVRGWILSDRSLEIYFREKNRYEFRQLNKQRSDVIEIFKSKLTSLKRDQFIGFNYEHTLGSEFLAIGIVVDGIKYELWQLRITPQQKIIKGLNNWLFLDNDTNRSVDQYTGDYLLNSSELLKWQEYLYSLSEITSHFKSIACLLIVPSKEKLLSEFYPFKKAKTTVINQIQQKLTAAIPIAYPIRRLENARLPSYRKCDTHWTAYGSMLGLLEALDKLGIDITAIEKEFEKDNYSKRTLSGDLGEKTYPISFQDEFVYLGPSYNSCIQYDSALPNIGRTIIIENKEAFLNKTCLLFGSSSSYTMLNFVFRVFEKIYFIHFAANIDPKMIKKIKPDYVICQTNERFCVKSPTTHYKLEEKIKEKWLQLTETEKSTIKKIQRKPKKQSDSSLCTWLDTHILD